MYNATKVRLFTGREGPGFNATLNRDGRPVCLVIDEGSGGAMLFRWHDWSAPRVTIQITDHSGQLRDHRATPEEAAFHAYLKGLPEHAGFMGDESYVTHLVEAVVFTKKVKAKCRRSTLFRMQADGPHDYRVFGVPYGPQTVEVLRQRYGDSLGEILNERPEFRSQPRR